MGRGGLPLPLWAAARAGVGRTVVRPYEDLGQGSRRSMAKESV